MSEKFINRDQSPNFSEGRQKITDAARILWVLSSNDRNEQVFKVRQSWDLLIKYFLKHRVSIKITHFIYLEDNYIT